jgi:hypothetical protein
MDVSSGQSFTIHLHHHTLWQPPVFIMIRLHELIACLQKAAKEHGDNIECDISMSDSKGHSMHKSELPTFRFEPDPQCGDWLDIRFRGEYDGDDA